MAEHRFTADETRFLCEVALVTKWAPAARRIPKCGRCNEPIQKGDAAACTVGFTRKTHVDCDDVGAQYSPPEGATYEGGPSALGFATFAGGQAEAAGGAAAGAAPAARRTAFPQSAFEPSAFPHGTFPPPLACLTCQRTVALDADGACLTCAQDRAFADSLAADAARDAAAAERERQAESARRAAEALAREEAAEEEAARLRQREGDDPARRRAVLLAAAERRQAGADSC